MTPAGVHVRACTRRPLFGHGQAARPDRAPGARKAVCSCWPLFCKGVTHENICGIDRLAVTVCCVLAPGIISIVSLPARMAFAVALSAGRADVGSRFEISGRYPVAPLSPGEGPVAAPFKSPFLLYFGFANLCCEATIVFIRSTRPHGMLAW